MKKQPMDKPFTYTYFLFSVNSPAHSFFFWLACCCLFFLLLFFCFWSSVSFPITFIHTRIRAFHLPFLITWNHKHQCITQIPKLKVDGFDCETSSTIHSHEFFAYIRNVEHTAYRSDCIYVPHRVILPIRRIARNRMQRQMRHTALAMRFTFYNWRCEDAHLIYCGYKILCARLRTHACHCCKVMHLSCKWVSAMAIEILLRSRAVWGKHNRRLPMHQLLLNMLMFACTYTMFHNIKL